MDIKISNYITGVYNSYNDSINIEYEGLYNDFENEKLISIFSTLHNQLITNYQSMNSRLPTNQYSAHFWAEQSRNLLKAINTIKSLERTLKNTNYAFKVDEYYEKIINHSNSFLCESGGSEIPPNTEKVDLYYELPIFIKINTIEIEINHSTKLENLKLIGEGSYAYVFKYKDTFYNKIFVLKRAKSDLNEKELERFKIEFEQMHSLHSPYIVEVFSYNPNKNEYIMEYMDYTLDEYIIKNNSKLVVSDRKNICRQILRAFKYIHSKKLLHRDINPKNVLLKQYEDTLVVKISDFGLIKIQDSKLTSISTEFKGYFNDPSLVTEGFSTYKIEHETYALTRLIYFVMTGRTNTSNIHNLNLESFVNKGLNSDKSKRFISTDEMLPYINSF